VLSTGDYKVLYYNKYGTHLKYIKQVGTCYTGTIKSSDKFLKKSRKKHKKEGGDIKLVPVSYTIDRRIFNSLDRAENYS